MTRRPSSLTARGLADRADADDPLEPVTTAAWFLPSRIDTPVDHRPGASPGVARARTAASRGNIGVTAFSPDARSRSVMPSATKAEEVSLNRVKSAHCRVVLGNPPLNLMDNRPSIWATKGK